jgi:hypothetical protein
LDILTMHGPINVKSPNNISKWQMGFNSAFKGLIQLSKKSSRNFFSDIKLKKNPHLSLVQVTFIVSNTIFTEKGIHPHCSKMFSIC